MQGNQQKARKTPHLAGKQRNVFGIITEPKRDLVGMKEDIFEAPACAQMRQHGVGMNPWGSMMCTMSSMLVVAAVIMMATRGMIGAEMEVKAAVTLSRLMRWASGICSGRVASVMAAVVTTTTTAVWAIVAAVGTAG